MPVSRGDPKGAREMCQSNSSSGKTGLSGHVPQLGEGSQTNEGCSTSPSPEDNTLQSFLRVHRHGSLSPIGIVDGDVDPPLFGGGARKTDAGGCPLALGA